jgi:hypothetical protein
MALSIIAIVLAAAFAYYSVATESQISTLKESGHSFCLTVNAAVTGLIAVYTNITQTLQQQIQRDNSVIATLNSTRPAGYEGMIAVLHSEITHDQAVLSRVYSLVNPGGLSSSPNTFCASVS